MNDLNVKNNIPGYFVEDKFYPVTNLSSGIIRVVLSTKCNYACPHCFQEGEDIEEDRDLSVDYIKRVIQFGKQYYGVHTVRLTGGEPLLYKDLDNLFNELREIGIENIDLTTNGYLIEEKVDILVKHNIKLVTVSLDTLNPEQYKTINGVNVDINKVLNGIKVLRKKGINVSLNLTALNSIGVEEIYKVIEYASKLGVVIRICEPTYIVGSNETEDKTTFRTIEKQLKDKAVKKIKSYCESVLYLQMKNNDKITIMYNLCDNRFCNSCAKYLYLRLTSDKKLKPCLSRKDNEVYIGDDLSDKNLHKSFCIAINEMGKPPKYKIGIKLIKRNKIWKN